MRPPKRPTRRKRLMPDCWRGLKPLRKQPLDAPATRSRVCRAAEIVECRAAEIVVCGAAEIVVCRAAEIGDGRFQSKRACAQALGRTTSVA
jgi:hypothetical protein